MFHTHDVKNEWKKENIPAFNELILTWNGQRPHIGKFLIYVSLKTDSWSSYQLYGSWGVDHQSSFSSLESNIKVYQDVVEVKNGLKATGFQVRLEPVDGAKIDDLRSMHVYTNSQSVLAAEPVYKTVSIAVPGLSQRILSHPRASDLCSPTSTVAVIQSLTKQGIDPVDFASKSLDMGFDIFGNWVLNLAECSTRLGKSWNCWVQRLNGFPDLYERLMQGTPVVVSVRGPLIGSALPYAKGHLLVVRGFDAQERMVLCMDPAFPANSETHHSYPLSDFMEAWNRRGFISYIFDRNAL